MALKIAGLIGLGVVWGWWTVPWLESRAHLPAAALVLTALVLQAIEASWLLGVGAVKWLIVGWAAGAFVNVVFRANVRAHTRGRLNS